MRITACQNRIVALDLQSKTPRVISTLDFQPTSLSIAQPGKDVFVDVLREGSVERFAYEKGMKLKHSSTIPAKDVKALSPAGDGSAMYGTSVPDSMLSFVKSSGSIVRISGNKGQTVIRSLRYPTAVHATPNQIIVLDPLSYPYNLHFYVAKRNRWVHDAGVHVPVLGTSLSVSPSGAVYVTGASNVGGCMKGMWEKRALSLDGCGTAVFKVTNSTGEEVFYGHKVRVLYAVATRTKKGKH